MEGQIEVITPSCNLETIRDGRGGIFTWVPKEPIVEFNMLFFKTGKIRGNHHHLEFIEYFLVAEGLGVMVSRDPQGNEISFRMSKGQAVRIPIGVPHAFYAITPTTAMSLLTKRWDDCDSPIHHHQLLDSKPGLP